MMPHICQVGQYSTIFLDLILEFGQCSTSGRVVDNPSLHDFESLGVILFRTVITTSFLVFL